MIIKAKANRGCHLKGMIVIPLKLRKPTVAVNSNSNKAMMPKYIISGFPNNKVKAKFWIILLSGRPQEDGRRDA